MPILYICLTIYAISVFVKIISFSEPTAPNISFHKSWHLWNEIHINKMVLLILSIFL